MPEAMCASLQFLFLRRSLLGIAIFGLAGQVHAAHLSWTNKAGGLFSHAQSWRGLDASGNSIHRVPGADDDAMVSLDGTLILDGAQAGKLFIGSSESAEGTLQLSVTGSYAVQEMQFLGQIRGPGSITAGQLQLNPGGRAEGVSISGTMVTAQTLHLVTGGNSGVGFTLRDAGRLTSTEAFGEGPSFLIGVVEGAGTRWEFQGLFDSRKRVRAWVRNGGQFITRAVSNAWITVEGAGAQWTGEQADLEVVTVSQGGAASCRAAMVTRRALVEGPGSVWFVEDLLQEVSEGITVSNGGLVNCGRALLVGGLSRVSGAGTRWEVRGQLEVNSPVCQFDPPGSLQILNGGTVTAFNCLLGTAERSACLGVVGADSRLLVTQDVSVGVNTQSRMEVRKQGRVESGAGFIGGRPGAVGWVSLTDPGTEWVLTKTGLAVGDEGNGTLEVGVGATVKVPGALAIGFGKTGSGQVALRQGGASLDASQAEVAVGKDGAGTLLVQEDSFMLAQNLKVGMEPGSTGTVWVSTSAAGPRAQLVVAGELIVGAKGGGRLRVGDLPLGGVETDAQVQAAALRIGQSSFLSSAVVDGRKALLEVTDLVIGDGGRGELTVRNQGELHVRGRESGGSIEVGRGGTGALLVRFRGSAQADQLRIGVNGGTEDSAGTVQVDGQDSVLTIRESLWVGHDGYGQMTVTRGGQVQVLGQRLDELDVAARNGALGILAVSGERSSLVASNLTVRVGVDSPGVLEISSGASMRSRAAEIGVEFLGEGQVIVGHPGASWTLSEELRIGVAAGDGWLFIDDGGTVRATNACLACEAASTAIAIVSGAGSTLRLEDGLRVGEGGRGAAGVLGVHNGATVVAVQGALEAGIEADSEALISVQWPGSVLAAANAPAQIAVNGTAFVEVLLGAKLETGAAELGVEPGSDATVFVGGTNSSWTLAGPLTVGSRGSAHLSVEQGGAVVVQGPLTIGEEGWVRGDGIVTVTELANGGVVHAGGSPGELRIQGNYRQLARGRLEIEIAGPTAGAQHSVLRVSGSATLGGTLVLRFIDGFAPRAGQTFEFLNATAGVGGAFSEVRIEGLAPGFQHQIRQPTAQGLALTALGDGSPASAPVMPRLTMRRIADRVVISWTPPTAAFTLQSAPALSGPWSNRVSGVLQALLPGTNTMEFFRLVRPGAVGQARLSAHPGF